MVDWLTKASAVCALNRVSSTLKPGFENMLSANDTNPLDKTKSQIEFQVILNKNVNFLAMNLLIVMICDTNATIMLIDIDLVM